eukprot:3298455-Pleurochrysis_carterae.AAC.2
MGVPSGAQLFAEEVAKRGLEIDHHIWTADQYPDAKTPRDLLLKIVQTSKTLNKNIAHLKTVPSTFCL